VRRAGGGGRGGGGAGGDGGSSGVGSSNGWACGSGVGSGDAVRNAQDDRKGHRTYDGRQRTGNQGWAVVENTHWTGV